jgi:hypothetical protein
MCPQAVVLVPVNRDALLAVPLPCVLFENFDAQQMFHNFCNPGIVVALDPHHFDTALRVRELAEIADELPVFAGEPGEIKVLEDVAEKDKALELGMSEQMQ